MPATVVSIFECECGATRQSPDRNIPVGWSARAGGVWCDDCTRTGIASRQLQHGGHPRSANRRKVA